MFRRKTLFPKLIWIWGKGFSAFCLKQYCRENLQLIKNYWKSRTDYVLCVSKYFLLFDYGRKTIAIRAPIHPPSDGTLHQIYFSKRFIRYFGRMLCTGGGRGSLLFLQNIFPRTWPSSNLLKHNWHFSSVFSYRYCLLFVK